MANVPTNSIQWIQVSASGLRAAEAEAKVADRVVSTVAKIVVRSVIAPNVMVGLRTAEVVPIEAVEDSAVERDVAAAVVPEAQAEVGA